MRSRAHKTPQLLFILQFFSIKTKQKNEQKPKEKIDQPLILDDESWASSFYSDTFGKDRH
jgi:hypothetical protein